MRRAAACLALVLLAGTAGCGEDQSQEFHGTVLDDPFEVPDTTLTDTSGRPFSLAGDTDERLTLVFFGYTHCPDICSTVLGSLASALTRLDESDREQVEVVFVTTDPGRDDQQAIRDYLDLFDPSFIGLRTDLATTVEVGRALAVGVDTVDPGGHTTTILALDSADEAPVLWSEDTSAAQFASDIHTLLAE